MSLKNKRVVIIGGSSGIGLATAKMAATAGAKVIIAGRTESKLYQFSKVIGDLVLIQNSKFKIQKLNIVGI